MMIQTASQFADYQMVLAGAPSIDDDYYNKYVEGSNVKLVHNDTYALLSHSTCALVIMAYASSRIYCLRSRATMFLAALSGATSFPSLAFTSS